jgi:type II secretory pathway component GspD/PulD (secretin)
MTFIWRSKGAAVLALALLSLAAVPLLGTGYAAEASGSGDSGSRQDEAADQQGDKKKAAEPEITLTPTGVTVRAVNVYAHLFFTRLAEKTGLQLVVDDAIKQRKVTVHLSNKPPQEVVSYVVSAYGLSSGEVNGVLMISEGIPRRPSSYLLSDIESIPTQYVQADNAKGLLPVFLQDHVKVNREQNAVVLSAPRDVLTKFRQDIQQFDKPAAQIMLEVCVVEFTDWDSAQYDLGLRWRNAGRGAEWGTSPLPSDGTASPAKEMGEVLLQGVADLPTEFNVRLEALVSARRARVRAAPRIATVSGRWASFFVGIQRYLRQPVEMPSSGDGWDGGMTNFIDAGVRLNIAPWTGDGEHIICDIRPEVSTLSALDPVTGLPEKSTRTADTTVRVQNGQTVIIGGLGEKEERRVRSKVPLLGDIPLVGALFRSSRTFRSQIDLVIFVTPRVLSSTGRLPADEEQRLRDMFLEEDQQ